MRLGQITFNICPFLKRLGQEVNMHLIGTELRALVAEMGKIQGNRVVLGLAKGKRGTGAIIPSADEDVVGARKGGATDQSVNAVQITPPRGTTPIVKGLVEAGLGAHEGRLIGGAAMGRLGLGYILLVHQHGPVPAFSPRTLVN